MSEPNIAALARRLEEEGLGELRRDEPLAGYTTWRMGGPADLLLLAAGAHEAARALKLAREAGAASTVLGAGSNLLVNDAGVRGLVIVSSSPGRGIRIEGRRVIAEAGVQMGDLARAAAEAGLSGLEHAANIPGTFGGLLVMNGGSNRQSIGERVRAVDAMDEQGVIRRYLQNDCGFGYRCSCFQRCGVFVLGAELELEAGDPAVIFAAMEEDARVRESKFPLDFPNCGSVFKSDPEVYERYGPPGKVLEDTGLKGVQVGGVQVSPKHANFFVNLGDGLATDAMALIDLARKRVHARTGCWMSCEVRHVDPQGVARPAHEALTTP